MDQEQTFTVEDFYQFYLAGFNLANSEGEADDIEEAEIPEVVLAVYRIGLEHGRRNPMPPNLPVSLNVFQERWPVGTLAAYARP